MEEPTLRYCKHGSTGAPAGAMTAGFHQHSGGEALHGRRRRLTNRLLGSLESEPGGAAEQESVLSSHISGRISPWQLQMRHKRRPRIHIGPTSSFSASVNHFTHSCMQTYGWVWKKKNHISAKAMKLMDDCVRSLEFAPTVCTVDAIVFWELQRRNKMCSAPQLHSEGRAKMWGIVY